EEFPWPVVRKAAEVGLYGFDLYAQTQSDPTGLSLPIVMEEICWGCAGIGLAIFGTGLPLSALAAAGTPEQTLQWAPRMFGTVDEPKIASFCVTEPNAGSDVSSLRTKAQRVDDGWVLNGQKIFATNGGLADVHIVVATVDSTLGVRGQASFIVSREEHKGIRQGKKEKKLGIRASHTAEVILEDCFVPDENLVGGQDKLDGKLEAGETAVRVTEQAIQILGGYGYIKDFPVEKWYRDAKIYTLFEGTSEIQRLVISRALANS